MILRRKQCRNQGALNKDMEISQICYIHTTTNEDTSMHEMLEFVRRASERSGIRQEATNLSNWRQIGDVVGVAAARTLHLERFLKLLGMLTWCWRLDGWRWLVRRLNQWHFTVTIVTGTTAWAWCLRLSFSHCDISRGHDGNAWNSLIFV